MPLLTSCRRLINAMWLLIETCVTYTHDTFIHAYMYHSLTDYMQQPYTVGRARPASPPTYFGLALFATLCCFWPLGVAAIFKSNEVGSGSVAYQQYFVSV